MQAKMGSASTLRALIVIGGASRAYAGRSGSIKHVPATTTNTYMRLTNPITPRCLSWERFFMTVSGHIKRMFARDITSRFANLYNSGNIQGRFRKRSGNI
jgi:hypothetical protein